MRREKLLTKEMTTTTWLKILAISMLGLALLLSPDSAYSQTNSPFVVGGRRATVEEAAFTASVEHSAHEHNTFSSAFKVSENVILATLHSVNDSQDFIWNPTTTTLNFPTAPELGKVKAIRIIPLETVLDTVAIIIETPDTIANLASINIGTDNEISANSVVTYSLTAFGRSIKNDRSWPETGELQHSDECISAKGRINMTMADGTETQPNLGDSGAALVQTITAGEVITKEAIGILAGFCFDPIYDGDLVYDSPTVFYDLTREETRQEIQQIIEYAANNNLSAPPQTNTYLSENGDLLKWDGITSMYVPISSTINLQKEIVHTDPNSATVIEVANYGTQVGDTPECVDVSINESNSPLILNDDKNAYSSAVITNDCNQVFGHLTPYEKVTFPLTNKSAITATFEGPENQESITDFQETIQNIHLTNPLILELDELSEQPLEKYEDSEAAISFSKKNNFVEVTVVATNRPLQVFFRLIVPDMFDQTPQLTPVIMITIPWTIEERTNPGTELSRTRVVDISEFLPSEPIKVFIPQVMNPANEIPVPQP